MKKTRKYAPGTVSRVLRYIGRYKGLMLLSAFLALINVTLTLLMPVLIGDAIDIAISGTPAPLSHILPRLLAVAGMALGSALLGWLISTVNNRVAYHVSHDIRRDAFDIIQRLPLSYLDTHPHGDTVSRIIGDVDRFADGMLIGFTQLFSGLLTIVGTMAFIAAINWRIALVVLLLTPLSLFIAKYISTHSAQMFRMRSAASAEQTSLTEEMISGIKVVKAFSHEDAACRDFDTVNDRLVTYSLRATFLSSLVNPTTRFVNSLVYAAVALVGGLSAIGALGAGALFTVGELTCLLSYTNQYTKPFNEISDVLTEFQNALVCAGRVLELIDQPTEQDTAAASDTAVTGGVELSDVSFSYTPARPLLQHISLSVAPGSKIAIVGPTGCGKTTLINLLMRFYDVSDGSISVDGKDIRSMSRRELRRSYGMVLQDTWLRAGTVAENIAMGRPDATRSEIEQAARSAHAHSFIKQLPLGYDTEIGESGGNLSAGQKQLLCIARIMLCLPPMLILDEATSSIDTRTEARISRAFDELTRGRTSFMVAHRLSTIRQADLILVMKDGNVVEQGTHRELLDRRGFYYTLYYSQFAHTE